MSRLHEAPEVSEAEGTATDRGNYRPICLIAGFPKVPATLAGSATGDARCHF